MKKGFTDKEKEFFKRQQNNDSKLKTILIVLGLIFFFGILLDALTGFSILRNSKSIFHGVVGLILVAVIYLSAEGLSTKINSKDKNSHPLYKRLLHFFLIFLVTISFIFFVNFGLNFINL